MSTTLRDFRDVALRFLQTEHRNRDQSNRFDRIFYEPFYVLDMSPDRSTSSVVFTVSGSTQQNHYIVTITESGRVACNCMDARLNCATKGCVCKHVCFVVFRVLRMTDTAFFTRLALTPEMAVEIHDRCATGRLGVHEQELRPTCILAPPTSSARPTSSSSSTMPDFWTVLRPPEAEDDCPVCYDSLTVKGPMCGCPDCGKGLHVECARRWLAAAAAKTCVYCRSNVWARFVARKQ